MSNQSLEMSKWKKLIQNIFDYSITSLSLRLMGLFLTSSSSRLFIRFRTSFWFVAINGLQWAQSFKICSMPVQYKADAYLQFPLRSLENQSWRRFRLFSSWSLALSMIFSGLPSICPSHFFTSIFKIYWYVKLITRKSISCTFLPLSPPRSLTISRPWTISPLLFLRFVSSRCLTILN